MHPRDLVKPPRRMGPVPALTVQGPSGLATGECWWLGMDTLSFLCPERFDAMTVVELRLDLGGERSPLFLRARVHAHAKGRHPRGYLHGADFEPAGVTTIDNVEAAVRQLNPSAAPRRRDPLVEAARDETHGRRLPGTTRAPSHTTAPTPDRAPSAVFDRGPPATMLIGFDTQAALKTHAHLDARQPRLVLPAVAGPRQGELLVVAVRLPSGLYVQAEAEVGVADRDTLQLRLIGTSPSVLAQLRHEAG